jgi:hypothetical protein
MAMTRAQFAKQLQDGLNTVFGMAYDDFPVQWKEIFTTHNSEKAFEEDVLMVGLGGAVVKPEGAGVSYDSGHEGWVARYQHITTALAFAITEEAVEDGRYGDLGAKYSAELARSMRYTDEVRAITVLNNAFSSGTTYGDGKELCATDHPLAAGGTLANELSTAADLSEEALEDAHIAIKGFVDDRGKPKQIRAKKLIIPRQLEFVAHRILKSTLQSGNGNNDTNAMKDMGAFPDGVHVNTYLSDPDAWFIITDCPDGLKHFSRRKLKKGMEGDFETGNMRYKASKRDSWGATDAPRAIFGSPGA